MRRARSTLPLLLLLCGACASAAPPWDERVGAFVARTASGEVGLPVVGPPFGVQAVRVTPPVEP